MARRILQDRIEELELGEDARTKVKAREKSKKKASAAKKSKRKYRALEEAKQSGKEDASTDVDAGLKGVEGEAAAPDLVRGGDVSKAAGD